ncbi:MAG: hypothetical protein JWR30_2350 [Conexibacter sp.]|nr:hypothetical protein [Conexibacter sp.]
MARGKGKGKGNDAAALEGADGGIRLSAHPRAARQIRAAKGWSGLIAFGVVIYLSRGAGLPFADALLRGVLGGIAGYLAAWAIAVTVWRHLALAELEDLRIRVVSRMETQAAEAAAVAAERREAQS